MTPATIHTPPQPGKHKYLFLIKTKISLVSLYFQYTQFVKKEFCVEVGIDT